MTTHRNYYQALKKSIPSLSSSSIHFFFASVYINGLFDPKPTNLSHSALSAVTGGCCRRQLLAPTHTLVFLAGKKDFSNLQLTPYYIIAMSRRNMPKLELKLTLSPPRISQPRAESPGRSSTESPTSPASSCLSSDECLRYSTSPEAASMMLVGCPNCLMYVMLAEEDPRCPKCKTTVLLDVIHDNTTDKNSAKIGSDQKKLD